MRGHSKRACVNGQTQTSTHIRSTSGKLTSADFRCPYSARLGLYGPNRRFPELATIHELWCRVAWQTFGGTRLKKNTCSLHYRVAVGLTRTQPSTGTRGRLVYRRIARVDVPARGI